jgi:hypothetical protein
MISLTNWCHLTAIDATPRNAPSGPSNKTLWPGFPQLTPPSHCTCGKDYCHKRKSSPANLKIASTDLCRCALPWFCELQQNRFCSARMQKLMQTRNQESDALGIPTGNMDTRWVPQCIITDVKMYTSRPRPVNTSWILSSSFSTIIKCHSYHPPTDCSWRPKTCRMLYKILIQKSHSLALAMTPYPQPLNWRQFSNSNFNKPCLPRLKLCLQRYSNAHALLNHKIKS